MEQEEKSGLECVGYMAFGRVDGKLIPLRDYTAETELAVKRKIMDVAWREGYWATMRNACLNSVGRFIQFTQKPNN